MNVELEARTEDHVRTYFYRVQNLEVNRFFPQSVTTLEQALENYRASTRPDAGSFGRTIYADGVYIGDIWCYGIDLNEEPNAMLSYCIFEKAYWNCGIMSIVLKSFLSQITARYSLKSVGAFTYSANTASVRVLEKNGFVQRETFVEDGVESKYLQLDIAECHA